MVVLVLVLADPGPEAEPEDDSDLCECNPSVRVGDRLLQEPSLSALGLLGVAAVTVAVAVTAGGVLLVAVVVTSWGMSAVNPRPNKASSGWMSAGPRWRSAVRASPVTAVAVVAVVGSPLRAIAQAEVSQPSASISCANARSVAVRRLQK